MKQAIVLALLALGLNAQADTINNYGFELSKAVMQSVDAQAGFEWKVGDTASYNMNMGFVKGKIVMTVKSVGDNKVVINQDMDMGFMGKQNCDQTVDTTNGKTTKIVCNGKDQDLPEDGDIEVIDITAETIKVPAGTFECAHIKAKKTSSNEEINQWAAPKQVPVTGMVKSIAPSQLGKVTIELTSFKKN